MLPFSPALPLRLRNGGDTAAPALLPLLPLPLPLPPVADGDGDGERCACDPRVSDEHRRWRSASDSSTFGSDMASCSPSLMVTRVLRRLYDRDDDRERDSSERAEPPEDAHDPSDSGEQRGEVALPLALADVLAFASAIRSIVGGTGPLRRPRLWWSCRGAVESAVAECGDAASPHADDASDDLPELP